MSFGGYITVILLAIVVAFFFTRNETEIISKEQIILESEPKPSEKFAEIFKIHFGYSSDQGRRPFMQDRIAFQNNSIYNLFGVFDGHGEGPEGEEAANFVKKTLLQQLEKTLPKTTENNLDRIQNSISSTFDSIDSEYCKMSKQKYSGSTAVVAVLFKINEETNLIVANTGDSRAILGKRKGNEMKAIPLSKDHKPCEREEKKRIEDAGGKAIQRGSICRVDGILATSRAFGDCALKPKVIATPEFVHFVIKPEDKYIILASDGLWDVLTNDEVVEFVHENYLNTKSTLKTSELLVKHGIDLDSTDNIASIVIAFK